MTALLEIALLRAGRIKDMIIGKIQNIHFGNQFKNAIAKNQDQNECKPVKEYDLIIDGAGPAGLSAALFAAQKGLKTVVLDTGEAGGQALKAKKVINYPGLPLTSGPELIDNLHKQLAPYASKVDEFTKQEITAIDLTHPTKTIETPEAKYQAKAVVIATGAAPRKLEIPGEKKFEGKGVSYSHIKDAPLFTKQTVTVIGGGNSAIAAAQELAKYADKVNILNVSSEFNADKVGLEEAGKNPKINIFTNAKVQEIKGNDKVESIEYKDENGNLQKLDTDGVFPCIGQEQNSASFKNQLDITENGSIKTDENLQTSRSGVYAAGDITDKTPNLLITAVADGARVIDKIFKYLQKINTKKAD